MCWYFMWLPTCETSSLNKHIATEMAQWARTMCLQQCSFPAFKSTSFAFLATFVTLVSLPQNNCTVSTFTWKLVYIDFPLGNVISLSCVYCRAMASRNVLQFMRLMQIDLILYGKLVNFIAPFSSLLPLQVFPIPWYAFCCSQRPPIVNKPG